MDAKLQALIKKLEALSGLSESDRQLLLQSIQETEKDQKLQKFKLDRLEHDKRTLSIMLEESIQDLEAKSKAIEAQNKELEIEGALERVRSVAMGMNRPQDLLKICEVLFLELKKLGFTELRNAIIHSFEVNNAFVDYDYSDLFGGYVTHLSSLQDPITREHVAQMTKRADAFQEVIISGETLEAWKDTRRVNGEPHDPRLENIKELCYYFYSVGPAAIGISTLSRIGERKVEMLKRFRNVFDLAYKRYVDISNAEALAKEAKIESALERMRAVVMSMHRSEQLTLVCKSMYDELSGLGFTNIRNAQVAIENDERSAYLIYVYSPHESISGAEVAYNSSPLVERIYKNLGKSSEAFFEKEYSEEEMKEWRSWRGKVSPLRDPREETANSMCWYMYSIGKGHIGISSYDAVPKDQVEIVKRFKNVFELSYSRFSDLQVAEAQTREAEIQLALERVRARTMAMQSSSELPVAANVLFQQIQSLGMPAWSAGYCIWNEDKTAITLWMSSEGVLQPPFIAPLTEDPWFVHIRERYLEGKSFYIEEMGGEELVRHYQYMRTLPVVGKILDSIIASGHPLPTYQIGHVVYFSEGLLLFITYEPVPACHDIFKRFGVVFEQTYTRFLDLQNAEAQTRESTIQLSLERVRARTMAMQKSDELRDASLVFYQQLQELGEPVAQLTIGIFKEDENIAEISASLSGEQLSTSFRHPLDEPIVMNKVYRAWKDQKRSLVIVTQGEELAEYNRFRNRLTNSTMFPTTASPEEKRILYSAFFSKGILGLATNEPRPNSSLLLLERFAAAFDLIYTRFNDLKVAEANAREAMVEAALERVRSRAMAMQNSDELAALIGTVFTELTRLDLALTRSVIWIVDEDTNNVTWWMANSEDPTHPMPCFIRASDHHPYVVFMEKWKEQAVSFQYVLEDDIKKDWDDYLFNHTGLANLPEVVKAGMKAPTRVFLSASFNNFGALNVASLESLSREHLEILLRFAKVFDLTYTRFNDLKQAEGQAREARIEAALERVRSKAMAMHSTEDLNPAVAIVFEEMDRLDIGVIRCGISVLDKERRTGDIWVTSTTGEGSSVQVAGDEPFDIHPLLQGAFNAWLRQEDFYYLLEGDDLLSYYKAVRAAQFQLPESQFISSDIAEKKQYCFVANYHAGGLFAFRDTEFTEEARKVMRRFAAVFDLTYKRFVDLQNAEERAKESQIQLALERARTQSTIMQRSNELDDSLRIFHEQVLLLGIKSEFSFLWLPDEENDRHIFWAAWKERKGDSVVFNSKAINYPLDRNEPATAQCLVDWKSNQPVVSYHVPPPEVKNYFAAWQELIDGAEELKPQNFKDGLYYVEGFMKYGCFGVIVKEELPEDQKKILARFATEFERTYTRFLDLQKAEAQAREAQIEAALERVRSRTMAMHKSDELAETATVLFKQLITLGIEPTRLYIAIINDESGDLEFWITDEDGNKLSSRYLVNIHKNISIRTMYNGWKEKRKTLTIDMQGDELMQWLIYWNKEFGVPFKEGGGKQRRVQNISYFSSGFIAIASGADQPQETILLLDRFSAVFNLTYTRFIDLQKAETQAKEATIEASLEKVRGRAMAMHNSEDLSATASIVFSELRKLGIVPIRCGVGLLTRDSRKAQLYSATSSGSDALSLIGWVNLEHHPVLESIYDSWIRQIEYFPELEGDSLRSYYHSLLSGLSIPPPDLSGDQQQYGHFIPFSIGCLYVWSNHRYDEDQVKTLKRFAGIIDLTFRRYVELQQSELNARETVKQAALDRVRADIASMRTTEDLNRITPLVWNELTILGIPFIRCGVFIMDESQELIHTFLSAPDGKAIGAFHIPYSTPGNIGLVLSHWREHRLYVDHWDETTFKDFAQTLVQQGALDSPETYLKTIPKGGFYLHFLPFQQGMLYVGNTTQVDDEDMRLIQSLAEAFSTAYARYEDFNRLEAAKKQVDNTLIELKQTQQQLVQSEKMASLGELTAGIAHEIQNPLNFVNNFSDVSNELLDEMKTEIEKGKMDDAMELFNDVKQNLEKILHHGKRADAIVKGMLQHSRTNTGQKELTDINQLADEYLRLAYHGLRAKDKSFNAKFETQFDKEVGKTSIIPQEIGRVILNLINNAFYAVSEKKQSSNGSYEPTVTVTTKKVNGKLEIRIKDNGNGVPQKFLDKIFQPFFTTKPTGQGTGLGLSLAYDIITKGHGGELKVETMEGAGSEFVIRLPV